MVSLTYEYGRSCAWLDTLPPERDPHSYDLCGRHAGALSVPLGWKLSDRREVAETVNLQLIVAPQRII